VVVVPSGSCTGSVRHQHAMVARRFGDEALARRAEAVAARTFELSELLIDVLGVADVGAYYPHRVTYHPTCHSLRLLRVGDRPLRLLRNVAGIDLVELPDAEVCCGFGGTFAVKNGAVSTAMLADKMRSVLATGAEICTAGDSSCLMHIGGGLSRLNAGTDTVHLAEILASTQDAARSDAAFGPAAAARSFPIVLCSGEDLGQVHRLGAGVQPGQPAADVHEARAVARGAYLRAGGEHGTHLVGQHRRGHGTVLHRERAAEPAAHLGVRQLHQVDARDVAQQPQRAVTDPQQAQRMAGRVVGDPVRVVRPDVLHPENINKQLRQLERARGDGLGPPGQLLVTEPARHHRMLMPHRARARGGRHDHHLAVLEDVHVPADQRQGLAQVAGVGVHLPAAGLLRRKRHLVTEPFQQPYGGPAHAGEQAVGQAGHEQRNPHGSSLALPTRVITR